MPLVSPQPIPVVVNRQLALNQGLDTGAANRIGILGAMIAPPLLGAVVARDLARREAPPPIPPPRDTGEGPVERLAPGDSVEPVAQALKGALAPWLSSVHQAQQAADQSRASLEQAIEQHRKASENYTTQLKDTNEAVHEICGAVKEMLEFTEEEFDQVHGQAQEKVEEQERASPAAQGKKPAKKEQ